MTAEESTRARPVAATLPRLPPAGTTWRFALLLLLFMFGTFGTYSFLAQDLSGSNGRYTVCVLAAGLDPGIGPYNYANQLVKDPHNFAAFQSCVARLDPYPVRLPLAATAALILAAFSLYWILPAWKARRPRTVPLDEFAAGTAYGELWPRLAALVSEAGLDHHTPQFAVDPWSFTATAAVFGRRPKYTIVLAGGLAATYQSAPARFRAVVLHELAHIANRDVDITYGVVALWRVFLAGALLPALADIFYDLARHDHWAWSWGYGTYDIYYVVSILFIVGLNYLARADILRFRERSADAIAGHWGADYPMRDKTPGASRPAPGTLRYLRHLAGSFGAMWRTHPHWKARQRFLADPPQFLAPEALTMFLTGSGAAATAHQVSESFLDNTPWNTLFQALLAAALLAAVGGGMLWRATRDATTHGWPAPSGAKLGIWLGLGIASSEFMFGAHIGRSFPSYPEMFAVLVVLAGLLFSWMTEVARLAAAPAPNRRPGIAMAAGLTALWLLLGYMMVQWYDYWSQMLAGWPFSLRGTLQVAGVTGSQLTHPGAVLSIATVPFALFFSSLSSLWWALSLLWLLPLLLWASRRADRSSRWLARAFLAGLLGGALGVAAAALAGGAHIGSPAAFLVYVTRWELVLCGTAMLTAITAAVTGVVRPYRLLAAVIAAATSALFGLLGEYALLTLDGCAGPSKVFTARCTQVVMPASWTLVKTTAGVVLQFGVVASGVAALGAIVILELASRNRHGQPSSRSRRGRPADGNSQAGEGHRGPRRATSLAVIACLACAVTIGIVGVITASAGTGAGENGTASQEEGTTVRQGAPISPPSPALSALQYLSWSQAGGASIAIGLERTAATIGQTLAAGAPSRQLAAACTTFDRDMSSANAYFTVPVAAGQRVWRQLLDGLGRISSGCTAYLASPTMAAASSIGTAVVQGVGPSRNFLSWFQRAEAVSSAEVKLHP